MQSHHLKLHRFTEKGHLFLLSSLLIIVLYVLTTKVGFLLATMNKSVSPVWPASAVGIIAFYLIGFRAALSVFLGAFIANWMNNSPLPVAFLIGSGNMLEALIGYYLLAFLQEKNKIFGEFSRIITLIPVAIFPPSISALIGCTTLYFFNFTDNNLLELFITWWVGDSMGILLILPMVFIYLEDNLDKYNSPDLSNFIVKSWVIFITLFGTSIIFSSSAGSKFVFLIFPILLLSIWTAGIKTTYYLSFVISILGIYLTSKNIGPFSEGSTNVDLIRVQFFSAAIILTTMVLEYLVKINEVKWSSAVLLGSWTLTGFTFYSFHHSTVVERERIFLSIVEKAEIEIRQNLDQYFRLLESGVGLMEVTADINANDWKKFVKALDIKDKYPGLNGIGIVKAVAHKKLPEFLAQQNLNLKLTEDNDERSIDRKLQDHYIITYLEPLEQNRQAQGLDLSAEKKRREGANTSLVNANSRSMTKIIKLVQDSKSRPGFLIFVPYKRNNKLQGFVYSPIIFEQFISAAIKEYLKDVNLEVFSNEILDPTQDETPTSTLIFKTAEHIKQQNKMSSKVFLADNSFSFRWSKTEKFNLNNNIIDSVISYIGAIFSLFLALGLASLKNTSKKANDLAELKTKELKETQLQLINSARLSSLGMMASGVAHEINNPLTIISGRARLISKLSEMPNGDLQKIKDYSENIISTVDKVTKVVKSMRLLARDGSKDGFNVVPLKNIINSALDVCREKLKNSHVEIRIDTIPEINLHCREVQLGQVLINLINNSYDAIELLPDKWIEIKFESFQNQVKIKVIDSGSGIPNEVAQKLMVPFFTTKDPGKGTGLGLSISRSIINDHQGTLEIDFGCQNTCFVITIPTTSVSLEKAA